jgi:hypothetical protein
MVIGVHKFGALPAAINFTLDTLVFFAISLRIVSHSIEDRALLRSFFRGDGLFSLSRSLLHSGQLYYWCIMTPFPMNFNLQVLCSATIGLNIIVIVLAVAPVSPAYAMFCIPNMALESSMACRVFRGIKLGTIEDTASFGLKSFSDAALPVSIAFKNDSTSKVQGLDSYRHGHIAIETTKNDDHVLEKRLGDSEGNHDGDRSSDDSSKVALDAV